MPECIYIICTCGRQSRSKCSEIELLFLMADAIHKPPVLFLPVLEKMYVFQSDTSFDPGKRGILQSQGIGMYLYLRKRPVGRRTEFFRDRYFLLPCTPVCAKGRFRMVCEETLLRLSVGVPQESGQDQTEKNVFHQEERAIKACCLFSL